MARGQLYYSHVQESTLSAELHPTLTRGGYFTGIPQVIFSVRLM
jgi:hypothetical protein